MEQKELDLIQQTSEELFSELGVQATVTVSGSEDSAEITVETEEGGMLIGYHGETLEAIQTLLPLLCAKKLGRFVRISVEIGDYRKNRTEYLENLAYSTKEKVLAEERDFVLSELKPWERRIVHMVLADDPDVLSESMGEGKERVLVIKKR